MATIAGTLKLQDKMSPALGGVMKAINSTLRAMESMDGAASAAFESAKKDAAMAADAIDDFAKSFDYVDKGAGRANDSINKTIKKALSLTAVAYSIKKAFDGIGRITGISDMISGASSRLGQLGTGLEDQIFASAQRSRSDYMETIDAVSSIGINAGNAFSGTGEIIAFSELLNKSFKLSGADSQAQAGAMRQLTQALASGVLRGDEFNSIAEQAPEISRAMMNYMGLNDMGELRKLAGEGVLTADIVKNAMFAAAADIEDRFAQTPLKFADHMTNIKNSARQSFGVVFDRLEEIANSEKMQNMVNNLISGFDWLAQVALGSLNAMAAAAGWAYENFDLLLLGLIALGIGLAIIERKAIAAGIQMAIAGLKSAAMWTLANLPLLLLIATIGIAIAVLSSFGVTGQDIMGILGGAIFWVIALFKNLGLEIANRAIGIGGAVAAIAGNAKTAFQNVGLGIKAFFFDIAASVLGIIEKIAIALNKLPFISFDYSGLSNKAAEFSQAAENARGSYGSFEDVGEAFEKGMSTFETFADGWGSDAFSEGKSWANGLTDRISNPLEKVVEEIDMSQYGGDSFPTELEHVGSVGRIDDDVTISEEDIKMLKDIAAMDYQVNLSHYTPSLAAYFGDVHETADAGKILEFIEDTFEEVLNSSLVVAN